MAKKDDQEKSQYTIARYKNRLSVLKKGQDYSQQGKIAEAVKHYNEYLNALAEFYEVKEENLKPAIFDAKKDVAEMLLISQVYWDLAKAYDRSPRLEKECERCLEQFALFTIGFKYQYLNSEMIRKFIKRRVAYHPEYFTKTYETIRVQSKSCYIATMCYGDEHFITNELREFKQLLHQFKIGDCLVELYYHFSPKLVDFCHEHSFWGRLITKLLRPMVYGIYIMFKYGLKR